MTEAVAGCPAGWPLRQSVELSRAAKARPVRRRSTRAGALPRGAFDPAAPRDDASQVVDVRARAWLGLGLGLGLGSGLGLGLGSGSGLGLGSGLGNGTGQP